MQGLVSRALSATRGRWLGARFRAFENAVHPATWARREHVLRWAEDMLKANSDGRVDGSHLDESPDPVVRSGAALRRRALTQFRGKLASASAPRVLIHVPDPLHSPGGFSLFNNLLDALEFIGIPAAALPFGADIQAHLDGFEPTVLLTSDHESYLSRIDWSAVARYRRARKLHVGLTASLAEYGNTPLRDRLDWARRHGVGFYFSFRAPEYIAARPGYQPFFSEGYRIVSVEFGANILKYYPVQCGQRDIDYVFLASSNPEKWKRYIAYLGGISRKHAGFIDGPGWSRTPDFVFRPDRDRYIYARARTAINLHIDNQIEWACELNERTYMLAACGVPQLVDRPKLLHARFSREAVFSADSPSRYRELFAYMLGNPEEAQRRALLAQAEVFSSHTTFHRAQTFVAAIDELTKPNGCRS